MLIARLICCCSGRECDVLQRLHSLAADLAHPWPGAAYAAAHALELARRTHAPGCEPLAQRLIPAIRPYARQYTVAHFLHLASV